MATHTKSGGPSSAPPPSSRLPGRSSGAGPYAFGALALAVAIAILLYERCSSREPVPPPPPPATTTAPPPLPENPPPPPEEEPDAGDDAGVEDAGAKHVVHHGSGGGPCSACGKGVPSSGLTGAVSSTASLARGCYQRALRSGGAEGSIMVSVSVGSDGSLCNSAITSDTLHNATVTQCVLSKFRARSYPRPKRGCVVVNVPIAFKMKTP